MLEALAADEAECVISLVDVGLGTLSAAEFACAVRAAYAPTTVEELFLVSVFLADERADALLEAVHWLGVASSAALVDSVRRGRALLASDAPPGEFVDRQARVMHVMYGRPLKSSPPEPPTPPEPRGLRWDRWSPKGSSSPAAEDVSSSKSSKPAPPPEGPEHRSLRAIFAASPRASPVESLLDGLSSREREACVCRLQLTLAWAACHGDGVAREGLWHVLSSCGLAPMLGVIRPPAAFPCRCALGLGCGSISFGA